MKLRRVDPKTIQIPETRVTARMDEETSRQFESSVKEVGIDEPIKCFEVDGQLILSDGLHRLMEAMKGGLDRVDVYVRPGTMVDVLCNNLMSGHLRGKHPVSEMRKVIESLYKEYSIGIEDIVKKTGLTQDYIEKLLVISELTPMCLEALDEGKIGVGQAWELTKLKSPGSQEVALQYVINNGWKLPQTKDYVAQVLALQHPAAPPPTVTAPQVVPTVKCRFCGEAHLPEDVASLIVCQVCQGIMYQAIAIANRDAQTAVEEAKGPIKVEQRSTDT